jgi:phospholipase A1
VKKIFFCAIIAFLPITLCATDTEDEQAYQKALQYEKQGNIIEAMKWYKKAATKSLHVKEDSSKNEPLLRFGKNSIKKYKNESTNESVEKIIFGNFDIKPYKANFILPYTYDFDKKEGRKQRETIFQLSFKKPLAKNILGLQDTLYLGYTQTSWWQTFETSLPFRETNYRPEIFFEIPYLNEYSPLKAYKIGLLHESNGRGGEDSRSWNRAYIQGLFQYMGVFISPRVWYRFHEWDKKDIDDANGDDNPYMYDYLGYGDLRISVSYRKTFLDVLLRNNLKFNGQNKGAVQVNWTFPLPWIEDMYGFLYYFNGYGESLIDYNRKTQKLGIGFSITR